ncbi:MAG: recombinase family protein [Candidatus Omnitrophica bacterium]|nr:recombinase family protein [Candidatus Omnitrophota bacterium]
MLDQVVMKTAGIYIRVSTEDQGREGYSLETQLEDCRKFIRSHPELREGQVYQDIESGYKTDREKYQRLIEDAETGRIQALIVWKVDRLTRNTLEGLRVLKHLVQDLGIGLFSATELIDTKTAFGKKRLRDAFSEAEYERDRLIERVMPGMRKGVQKGHWQGARYCFYGYRYDKPNTKLVEIPEEIKILRETFRLRASGLSHYSVALRLADQGIRNRVGRHFTTHQIEVMLHRNFYLDGHLEWSGVRSEQPVVKPVIAPETWEKVQAVNVERTRESNGIQPGRVSSPYVLQGVLKCQHCGGNMVGNRSTVNKRTKEKAPWYVCGQKVARTRKACRGQSVKADRAHPLAFEILKKAMSNPQLMELTRQEIRAALERGHPDLSRRVRELRSSLRFLKQAQEKCLEAYYEGAITTEQLKAENQRLFKEIELAQQELAQVEAKMQGAETFRGSLDRVFDLLQEFDAVWAKMTPVQQRIVYRGVFNFLAIEGRPRGRQFKVKDFSLKEPFKSWHEGRSWEGSLILTETGSLVLNDKKDKNLCESYGFAPTAAR